MIKVEHGQGSSGLKDLNPATIMEPAPAEQSMSAVDSLPEAFRLCTQWVGREPQRRAVSSLQLSGLYCAACAPTIESALLGVHGVDSAHVNGSSRRATVRWDPRVAQAQDLLVAVERAGYAASPDVPESWQALRRHERRSTLWRLFVASFCAMQVMMMATPSYVAGPDELSPDLRQLLNWGSWVLSIPALWFSGSSFLVSAWRAVKRAQMSMDVPVALALGVTFIGSTVATFEPTGPLGDAVYFDSLTMFLAFLWLGRYLEMHARHRAEDSLQSRASELPATALRVHTDHDGHEHTEEVALHELEVGNRVRVVMGAALPADGILRSESAWVSEALMTGESTPVQKCQGGRLLAGSLNQGSAFDMVVEQVGSDTRYAEIVALMRESVTLKPEVARVADRWAGPFLGAVLVLAFGAAWAWHTVDPSRALWVAVAVLTVTCPCALSLALPATWTALAMGLARHGVLLRRLDAIEPMAALRHVMFDKTGTLTQTHPSLQSMNVWAGVDRQEVLEVAMCLAQGSHHPMAQALSSGLASIHVKGSGDAVMGGSPVEEVPGAGIEAVDLRGRAWRLGRQDWACPKGWAAPEAEAEGNLWLGLSGQGVAVFKLGEQLHAEAVNLVASLKGLGVGASVVSGDGAERVQAVAQGLGLSHSVWGASPERKLQVLMQIQQKVSPVGVVGDGVNDAPTMARADVSFAMGQGASLTQSGADAVLVAGSPLGVVWAIRGARRALTIARQNLWWAVAYNLTCIPLALWGWLPPWAAGLGMAASSTAVVLNAQRAGRFTSIKELK